MQRELREARLAGQGSDVLLTLEHCPPVLTAGRRARPEHLRVSREVLVAAGFQVRAIERGGDWTFHGPGQLVAYPVVALQPRRLKVPALVAGMEAAMAALARHALREAGADPEGAGLALGPLPGFPGCWAFRADQSRAKVGAIGVHVHRGVCIHGLALNVDPVPWGFDRIVPCGLLDEVTSLAKLARELGAARGRLPGLEALATHLAALLPLTWEAAAGSADPAP